MAPHHGDAFHCGARIPLAEGDPWILHVGRWTDALGQLGDVGAPYRHPGVERDLALGDGRQPPVDVRIGRDLPSVPGGEVVLP